MTPQARPVKKLGTTSYAVLGLLALRDWTTYELAQQMERGIGRMWAASPSMVYEEPKHLVAHGYAEVRESPVGRRPRSSYSITPLGRQALAAWLADPPAPPALQFEGILKVLFADQGDASTIVNVLETIEQQAAESRAVAVERGRGYRDGEYIAGVDLEGRSVVVAQTLAFLAEFHALVERWATWSADLAQSPDAGKRAQRTFVAVAAGRRVLR
jgi:DNA-binding PadR family transcriptional regulator